MVGFMMKKEVLERIVMPNAVRKSYEHISDWMLDVKENSLHKNSEIFFRALPDGPKVGAWTTSGRHANGWLIGCYSDAYEASKLASDSWSPNTGWFR